MIQLLNEWFGYEVKDLKQFLDEFESEFSYHQRLVELIKFLEFVERKNNK